MKGFNPSTLAMQHALLAYCAMVILALAGAWAYLTLGRAEDPPFTIKQMVVQAGWPGASADEMSRQIADPIERKLEELPFLDNTQSVVEPGSMNLTVTLKGSTPAAQVPALWYQVRKKIGDIRAALPTDIQGPFFSDEYDDVFGIVYAVTGDGFTLPELRHIAEDIREQLLSVPGVGKLYLVGVQDEVIWIDASNRKLAQLKLTAQDIQAAVAGETEMAPGGSFETANDRIFVRAPHDIGSIEALRDVPIAVHGRLLRLGDIATIHRGLHDPPQPSMLVNDRPAIGLAVSMSNGGNILDLGRTLRQRLQLITRHLPVGVKITLVHDQARVVARDIGGFEEAFLEALSIVLLVSFFTLGWRSGLVVSISVVLVLAGVLVGMKIIGIDLQRISLGAMIIALGLLVDDAIIAVETMAVKLEEGFDRLSAGSFKFTNTSLPMLTGTLITIVGYLPVGLARSSTGEFTQDICRVVGLALILSWFVAVLFVPVLGAILLRPPRSQSVRHDPYATAGFHRLRDVTRWYLRRRWLIISVTSTSFAIALAGFSLVPQQFFPVSDRLEIMIDLHLPEGSSYSRSFRAVEAMQRLLHGASDVESVVAHVGTGSPRFILASAQELDHANVAQIVVNTTSIAGRERLLRRILDAVDRGDFPDIRVRASRLELGPPVGYPMQYRVLGPDPAILHDLAGKLDAILRGNAHIRNVSDSWGNPAKAITVSVDRDKARLLGISSKAIADSLQLVLRGSQIATYREGVDQIPVMLRGQAAERLDPPVLEGLSVPTANGGTVPLAQVARLSSDIEEPVLWRRNRTPMVVVRGDIADAAQAPDIAVEVQPAIAALSARLPEGYQLETGGIVEELAKGQDSVKQIVPLMLLGMFVLLIVQTQSLAHTALVILTAPLGLVGVTAALLVTGSPFGFVALLGFIALSGIIMRNSVILVSQIEREEASGRSAEDAIVEAVVRRARPILLTAATAAMALIPLAFSVFWGPMAITLIGGLVSGTALTLCAVPALYATWHRLARHHVLGADGDNAHWRIGQRHGADALRGVGALRDMAQISAPPSGRPAVAGEGVKPLREQLRPKPGRMQTRHEPDRRRRIDGRLE